MAKLLSSYSLCPLIEQRKFFGISDDSVSGYVIVTLAKNIVIRYKLLDQKQISSWSSKDKLSAPVVYDSVGNQYIGVFNGDQVAFWQDNCLQLNKLKKYKFTLLIHSVLTAPGVSPVLVYRNGFISPLSVELDNRKSPEIDFNLPTEQTIEEVKLVNINEVHFVYLLAKTNEGIFWLHFVPVDRDKASMRKVKLVRDDDDVQLRGMTVMDIETSHLVTLWSDGKVFTSELVLDKEEWTVPGTLVMSALPEVNLSLPVAMVPVSSVHVAIYAANTQSEGAVLAIFNTKFGVVQCSSHMKLYCNPPRLWRSGSQLVLIIGQYLAVAPFKLATPKLATLVASHQPFGGGGGISASPVAVVDVNWGKSEERVKKMPSDVSPIRARVEEMLSRGLTQRAICDEILEGLLKEKDVDSLEKLVHLLSDIPEEWVMQILTVGLEQVPGPGECLVRALTSRVPLVRDSSTLVLARSLLSLERALVLLSEISSQLDTPSPRLVDWAIVVLDSHYQQFLLSKDKVVFSILSRMNATVNQQLDEMKELKSLKAYVEHVKTGRCFSKITRTSNNDYLIEKIQLY